MKLSLLFFSLLCAQQSFSQTYTFNRQTIIKWDTEHKSRVDVWHIPLTIEVQKKIVIMSRPANGAGEKPYRDTLVIKSNNKERRDKREVFTKYKFQDGRVLIIYGDQYMTMCTKETKDHKRTEYVFYNQEQE